MSIDDEYMGEKDVLYSTVTVSTYSLSVSNSHFSFSRFIVFLLCIYIYIMSRCIYIANPINLEKSKRLIIWTEEILIKEIL